MRGRSMLAALCLAAALALAAAGCGSGGGAATTSGGAKAVKLALFVPATSTTYYQAVIDAVKAEAAKQGASVDLLDPNYDPQKQFSQCQDAITSKRYQAFVIFPVDGGAIVPCARNAIQAGIKVVGTGGPIGPKWDTLEPQVAGVTGYAFPLAQTSGQRLAQLAKLACRGTDPCKLLYEIGNPAFGYDSSLLQEFKKALPAGIEIAAQVQTDFNPDEGRTKTRDALEANSDIHVVVTEDTTARGVIPALEQAGLSNKVKVISGGGSAWASQQVRAGRMVGTVPFVPRTSAQKMTALAVEAARGERLPATVHIDEGTIPNVQLVTKDTVAEWKPQL